MKNPQKKESSPTQLKKKEQENAEKKLEEFASKRNEFNEMAKLLRDERNQLNDQKRELNEELDKLFDTRKNNSEKMRVHKEKRNSYQARAREFIKQKRERSRSMDSKLPVDVNLLRAEIRDLEYRQQTTPMTLEKDREFIKKIKAKQQELKALNAELTVQEEMDEGIKEMNQSINGFFERADEEHAHVVRLYEDSRVITKKIDELKKERAFLNTESDKKHNEFLKIRERADKAHQRFVEMLEKLNGMRGERREEIMAKKKIFMDYKKEIDSRLNDGEYRKEREEGALESLLSGKAVSLHTLSFGSSDDDDEKEE